LGQIAIGTRLTLGTAFMNVDLARMLDEHYSKTAAGRASPPPDS
jgi:hypothetical protein